MNLVISAFVKPGKFSSYKGKGPKGFPANRGLRRKSPRENDTVFYERPKGFPANRGLRPCTTSGILSSIHSRPKGFPANRGLRLQFFDVHIRASL